MKNWIRQINFFQKKMDNKDKPEVKFEGVGLDK